MIKSVKGMKIGGYIEHKGNIYIITKFPTRYSLCAKAEKLISGKPSSIKVPISNYVQTVGIGNGNILTTRYSKEL